MRKLSFLELEQDLQIKKNLDEDNKNIVGGVNPGTLYTSANAAATAWGNQYGQTSINTNQEYASVIYTVQQNGVTYYTYTAASTLESENSSGANPNSVAGAVGVIHSHGAYDSQYGDGNDVFSSTDISNANAQGLPNYLCAPDGFLSEYDPNNTSVNDGMSIISTNMPYDPNDPHNMHYNNTTIPPTTTTVA